MAGLQARLGATARRQQILGVATAMFARRGFQGTTTREIAQRARVNEALIFRHFPTKEDLYWGVIDAKCRQNSWREQLAQKIRGAKSTRELLVSLATDLLERDPTMSRLLWFSALENHRLSGRFFQTYMVRYYRTLAEYLRRRMEAGELRKMDPLLASRCFLGMVNYHFYVQEIFGGKRYQKFDPRRVAEGLVDTWLTGVAAPRLSKNGKNGRNGDHAGQNRNGRTR